MLGTVTQHPSENLRYDVDYSQWLNTDGGELLSGVTVSVDPVLFPTLNVIAALSADQQHVRVTVYGGAADQDYTVNLLATTTFNQKDHDCFGVLIRETC